MIKYILNLFLATSTRNKTSGLSSRRIFMSLFDSERFATQLLQDANITRTKTKAGWCLNEGLVHLFSVDNGKMIPLVEHHGVPLIYNSISPKCRHSSSQKTTTAQKPSNCFQSLCRIVAGQQLAGPAAQATWTRLLKACNQILTPQSILGLAEEGFEDCLRQPAGLSNNKAKCIVALAQAFQDKELTEAWLCESSESDIRKALLKIKGLGPWSCDMFLMFFLEQGDIFPVGDLGVRKGVARFFNLKGKGKGGSLCPKKDFDKLQTALEPFKPYRSLVTYYMWKVADTKDFYKAEAKQETDSFTSTSPSKKKRKIH